MTRKEAGKLGGRGRKARFYGQSWMLIRAKARLTKPA
jgi:hypothetical protein